MIELTQQQFEPRSEGQTTDQQINSVLLYVLTKVIPKKLWIEQVIHALTVTNYWLIHALTVTKSRINGHLPNKEPIAFPINGIPIVGASLNGDNLSGCHPISLLLLPTAFLNYKNKKTQTESKIKEVMK